jgi:uncharacterized damage-inducible protein DinB
MSEIERIRDQLKRSHQGEAWHGPSLGEVLDGISAERAAARPLGKAHTIWELVLHMVAWIEVARLRLEGERIDSLPDEEDFPKVVDPGEEAWRQALAQLDDAHARLDATLSRFEESRLDGPVPLRQDSYYTMLHGLIQHNAYHAGQIVLLGKAT